MVNDSAERGGTLRTILRLLVLLCLSALVIFVVANYENINYRKVIGFLTGSQERKTADVLDIAADSQNSYFPYRGGLAVLSRGGLSVIGPDNEEILYVQKNFQRPFITGNGKSLLACDIGRTPLIYVLEEQETTLEWTGEVISAEINTGGYIAIVAEESGSKATATVLSPGFIEEYKWFSSERYLLCASVSPKNDRMAVGGISEKNARIVSTVCLFDLNELEMQASYEFFDSLILSLSYVEENRIAVLAESSLKLIDEKGQLVSEYPFQGRFLHAFDFSSEGFLTLLLGDASGAEVTLMTFDFDGNPLGSRALFDVLSVSAHAGEIAVLTSEALLLYNKSLDHFSEHPPMPGVRRVLLREDGSALLIGPTKATLYIP